MSESSDRAARWVQMWLDVSSEPAEASPSGPTYGHKRHTEEDFENNGLVIMQRKLMRAYARLSPEDRIRLGLSRKESC
jgi:hypothetical protein